MKPGLLMPVAELARCCAEEMARYRRGQCSDPRYCYELFRCALVEQDEEAWAAVYSQYHRLVCRWLGDAPGDPDGLVNETFERLWRAIPPDRFGDFSTLGGILEYLKRCARCVAVDARRREERKQAEEAALARMQVWGGGKKPSLSEQALDAIVGEQLIEYARERLHGLGEKLAFHASFEWNLRPGAIAERWPDIFASAREVSRIKERILRRLRRDEGLRALLGMDD
jgi:DNA-directed RNA polymerase specialized sigma24 family protein